MTDPGRYDRPGPGDDCGEPHHGKCAWADPDWVEDDYCVPGCPDDVCRSTGRCAWPRPRRDPSIADLWADVDPTAHGLRLVRDLRTGGEVL